MIELLGASILGELGEQLTLFVRNDTKGEAP